MSSDGKQANDGFRYDQAYLNLKQEAHRRGASDCIAPSLIWHLGVWPHKKVDPQCASTEAKFNDQLEIWVGEINAFLARLQHPDLLTDKDYQPRFSINKGQDEQGRNRIWHSAQSDVEFDLLWRGLRIQVKVEIRADYATITFLTNLADGKSHDYKARIEAAFKAVSVKGGAQKDAAAMLYETVWSEFAADILTLSQVPDADAVQFHPGEIFVSLRGVVPVMEPGKNGWMSSYIPLPETWTPKREPGETFGDEKCHLTLNAHEFFITPYGFQQDEREFVACRMMNDRALFISALGAVSERRETREESDHHIRYTLFLAGKPNARQVGRLVELINTLGTLQIIALKDLDDIRDVGTQIRLTGDKLDLMSEDFHKSIEDGKSNAASLELELCTLETQLERISKGPTGGLQYRVARSRYYAEQFEKRIADLGLQPIDRWQTYDVFARRRLIPVFTYVSGVGQRMINLRTRLHTILESVQTKTLIDVNDGLLKIQKAEQWQTIILFVIAVAAFFGEVVEPIAKMGGSALPFLQRVVEYFGNMSTCDGRMLEEATKHLLDVSEGELQRVVAAKEACGGLYKFFAYAFGIVLAIIIVILFYAGERLHRKIVGKTHRH